MDAHTLRLPTVIPLEAYPPPCDACEDVDTSKYLQVGLMVSRAFNMLAVQYFKAPLTCPSASPVAWCTPWL